MQDTKVTNNISDHVTSMVGGFLSRENRKLLPCVMYQDPEYPLLYNKKLTKFRPSCRSSGYDSDEMKLEPG